MEVLWSQHRKKGGTTCKQKGARINFQHKHSVLCFCVVMKPIHPETKTATTMRKLNNTQSTTQRPTAHTICGSTPPVLKVHTGPSTSWSVCRVTTRHWYCVCG